MTRELSENYLMHWLTSPQAGYPHQRMYHTNPPPRGRGITGSSGGVKKSAVLEAGFTPASHSILEPEGRTGSNDWNAAVTWPGMLMLMLIAVTRSDLSGARPGRRRWGWSITKASKTTVLTSRPRIHSPERVFNQEEQDPLKAPLQYNSPWNSWGHRRSP